MPVEQLEVQEEEKKSFSTPQLISLNFASLDTSIRVHKTKLEDLAKAEKEIYSFIRNFGSLRVDQLQKFMRVDTTDPSEVSTYEYYIRDLISKKVFRVTDSGYIVATGIQSYDAPLTECLWDVINNLDDIDMETLDRAQRPSNLMYMLNDGTIIINTFISKNKTQQVMYLQERYFARQIIHKKEKKSEEDDTPCVINQFVVTDAKTAIAIRDKYTLTMPCRICLVDYESITNGMPDISYYPLS